MNTVLLDTMVWSRFFSKGDNQAAELLGEGRALVHPYVLAELALSEDNAGQWRTIIRDLSALDAAPVLDVEEVIAFARGHKLTRSGVGFVDVAILAAADRVRAKVWTDDLGLRRAALKLRLLYRT